MEQDPKRFLVAIRGKGTKPPVFLVHSLAGELTWLPDLARQIDPHRPLYGFAAPGLNARGPFFHRLEDMAAGYLAAVRTVQPRGPYLLGGYSFGGILAYEMARQAELAGDEVAKLILIDSYTPDSAVMRTLLRWQDEGALILSVCNMLGREWNATALLEPAALPAGDPWGQVDVATRHLMAHCRIPHGYDALSGLLEKCRQVMNVHTRMLVAYQPRSMAGIADAILIHNTLGFVSADNPLRLPASPAGRQDHGWQHYLRRPPRLAGVGTEHFLMMRPPALQEVARLVEAHLYTAPESCPP